jgi:CheY-like chemotaxis protein
VIAVSCHHKTTILVVEDDVLTRMAVSEELREHGYLVIEAEGSDEALAVLLGPTRIDLLLTDMRMPGAVDGCGLARKVRAALPLVKIVMVSGQTPEPDAHSMLDGYLAKPVAPSHLANYLLTLSPTGLTEEVAKIRESLANGSSELAISGDGHSASPRQR